MFEFGILSARCFDKPRPISIKPITFFVGENSSGKTSAAALIASMLSSLSSSRINFNAAPFTLGGYNQIAHFRGGKAGRARQFELTIQKKITDHKSPEENQRVLPLGETVSKIHNAIYKAVFTSRSEKPYLAKQEFSTERGSILLDTLEPEFSLRLSIPHLRKEETIALDKGLRMYLRDTGPPALYRALTDIRYAVVSNRKQFDPEVSVIVDEISRSFSRFSRQLPANVIASAPIRSKPARTYNPGEEDETPEGGHVPYAIARLKAEKKKSWEGFSSFIGEYGKSSSLFDKIEVKRFGRQQSDPFQITVKNKGPAVNIVDTGYGISQILPVLFDVYNMSNRDMLILQQPEVHLHPKAQAELGDVIQRSVTDQKYILAETHSDFIIDRVRNAIRKGKLSNEKVSIVFFEHKKSESEVHNISLDESGDPIDPPQGYRDFFVKEQLRNIT